MSAKTKRPAACSSGFSGFLREVLAGSVSGVHPKVTGVPSAGSGVSQGIRKRLLLRFDMGISCFWKNQFGNFLKKVLT